MTVELGETILVEFEELVLGTGVWELEVELDADADALEVDVLMDVDEEFDEPDDEGIGVELWVPLGEMLVMFSTTVILSLQLVWKPRDILQDVKVPHSSGRIMVY